MDNNSTDNSNTERLCDICGKPIEKYELCVSPDTVLCEGCRVKLFCEGGNSKGHLVSAGNPHVHYVVFRSRREHPEWWAEIYRGFSKDFEEALETARSYKNEHRSDNAKVEKITTEIFEVKGVIK